jgi:hypothetical protein
LIDTMIALSDVFDSVLAVSRSGMARWRERRLNAASAISSDLISL